MLAGEQGEPVHKAMEILVALGQIYHAEDFVPVAHVQIAGVSYKNLGDAGLEFLLEWADRGARVRVPTTLNPAGMDTTYWQEIGIPASFAQKQGMIVDAYTAMGVEPTLTCTPYQVGHRPALGEHLAWSESSAVSFANSVLGARTNREGGPSALAAALTGLTPRYGFHLDSGRLATHLIQVRCPLRDETDFGALGYLVGQRVHNGVPYFRFEAETLDLAGERGEQLLKTLGAAMAASGAIALYHIEGVTLEARQGSMLPAGVSSVVISSLEEAFAALNSPVETIDFVSIGCPHASLIEIAQVARLLEGKRLRAPLWVTTARQTRAEAEKQGLVKIIEEAGGYVVADTCMVVAPLESLQLPDGRSIKSIATNSAKAAFYAPSYHGVSVRFGSLAQCIEASLTGKWTGR